MITLERRKEPLTLEPHKKASCKVLTLKRCFQQEPSPLVHLFMGAISYYQLEVNIVDMQRSTSL